MIRTRSGRQNWPIAASMPGAFTPPSRVLMHSEARASAISSLSTVDGVQPSAVATQIRTMNPMDGFESSDSEDDVGGATVNSPDKEYNFKGRKSDDDSVASGDDSITWERETMKIMATFADATALEEGKMEAAAQEDAPAVREIGEYDFEFLADGGFDAENPPPPPVQQYESRRVEFKTTNVKSLKAIALVLNVSGGGTKRAIFERCCDSPTTGVEKISDDEFEYRHPVEVGADGVRERMETWVVLDPEDVPPVAGIDMATGASRGFFGPTNKENAVGATRTNFLTSSKIERPEFGPKHPPKKRTSDGDPPPPREDGHPSDACRVLIPPLSRARPKDFFDTQLTPKFMEYAVEATNLRAYASGAGSGQYADFIPFDLPEFYKMLGVLFANGLIP